jgi:hypothetical protein
MTQAVYLVSNERQWIKNHRRRRIHRAWRSGTRGRALSVGAKCQIYEPYYDNYDVLTDLHSLGESLEGWDLCRHCFPAGRSDLPETAFTDIRAKQLVMVGA